MTAKYCLVALIAFLCGSLACRLLIPSYPGEYNIITGKIHCINDSTCAHEEGHAADAAYAPYHWQLWNWESAQPGWRARIDNLAKHCPNDEMEFYRILCNFPGINGNPKHEDRNPSSLYFWTGGWGGYTELYAELYKHGHIIVWEVTNE